MIHWLKRLFTSPSIVPVSNNKHLASAASFAFIEEDHGRGSDSERSTGRRGSTTRTTVPTLVNQPITITNNNGDITIEPLERDLYDGEQIEWICQEPAWEIRFDQVGSNTPFYVDEFGPGLLPALAELAELPAEDLPSEVSGAIRADAAEGNYYYSAQVGGFGPAMARVKIIRGGRP